MAITPNQYSLLVEAPILQNYLVDKDTGAPLSAGIVTFYKDNDRQTLKNVYYQTGSPGNYSYIPLPNPNTLSAVGTITDDGGNDTLPFYFPYDEDDTDIVETYYVTIESSGNISQFTRENFPFTSLTDNTNENQQELINLIPNGQFTAHNDFPNGGLYPNGTSDIVVAQGGSVGWYYTKDNGSTDTDHVTFTQILQEPDDLVGNPRFSINIDCTNTTGGDTFKELRMRFNNVNRFASDTQSYTFSFSGISNSASSLEVFLKLIKNFGTGGSSTSTTTIEGFTLTSGAYKQFSVTFFFGTNSAATIGSLNDDYIELAMVFPATSTFDVDMTDFILTPGFVNFNEYPERPDNMVFADALTGSLPTPNADGSSLYLPVVITQGGATYDTSVIGRIESYVTTPGGNTLLCDGSTYLTTDYSSLGIPYSRLQQKLVAANPATLGAPLYGTGSTFATAYIQDGLSSFFRLVTNQAGAQTLAADGAISTGFSFATLFVGQTTTFKAYRTSSTTAVAICNTAGTPLADASAGTSGFTVTQTVSNNVSYGVFTITPIAASGIAAGTYFTFSSPSTNYYCWFTIDGAGADPAPGGTGIQVNLLSTYTALEVNSCVVEAVSGFAGSRIGCVAASSITPGAFFTFNANSITYSVWYKKAGSGTAPSTGTPLQVTLTGTETAAQVASATESVILNYSFGVPDFRGLFPRGVRDTGQWDINAASRYSPTGAGAGGNTLGTFELDTLQSHTHDFTIRTYTAGAAIEVLALDTATAVDGAITVNNFLINSTGSAETQPNNFNVNWYIRY